MFRDILELKNNFLDYKTNKLKKSQNWDFYKGVTPWFSWKINYFPISFFFGNIGEEKCVLPHSTTKTPFLGYKN